MMTVAGKSDLVGAIADRDSPDDLIARRVEDQDILAGLDADVEPPPVTGRRQPVGMRPTLTEPSGWWSGSLTMVRSSPWLLAT